MSKQTLPLSIALAACSFGLPDVAADQSEIEIQLTPDGSFRTNDIRPVGIKAWQMSPAIAAAVINRYEKRQNEAVVDYEHQTLLKERNGQPAPAAGWIKSLAYRPGQGLFGVVALTERARQLINSKEYRYVSPVFEYDQDTGDLIDIRMAALTNHPGIQGMEPLAALTALALPTSIEQENPVNRLMLAVCAALSLAQDATEDQAIAAINQVGAERKNLRDVLKLPATADSAACVAACSALSANPDPARFVPVSALESVKTELAALTAKTTLSEVNALVEAGLKDGRLLPAQKDWAIDLGKSNIAALTGYLQKTPAIAVLSGDTQTKGEPPSAVAAAAGLTDGELAVCTSLGIKPEDFKKNKAA